MAISPKEHPASYRDPAGFIFEQDGKYYRQVNKTFQKEFDHFLQSGCYADLVAKKLLIPHEEITGNLNSSADCYKVLLPRQLPFVSQPGEWSFSMLREAALLTLEVNRTALAHDMILKDATPYNIQWLDGGWCFIDTLSFAPYTETPWVAYRQFCETFLAPLLLMHYGRIQAPGLLLGWPEGVPLATAAAWLPGRSRFSLHANLHIHLHARLSGKPEAPVRQPQQLSKPKLLNLLTSLEVLIRGLKLPKESGHWSQYYAEASQRDGYLEQKKQIITRWLENLGQLNLAIDLGTNDGLFARLLREKAGTVIAVDQDPVCVDRLYRAVTSEHLQILPLVVDLAQPTPAIGFANVERAAFIKRAKADLVTALALIHHLAIGKNIPLARIAELLAGMAPNLFVEFVPKTDPQLENMLKRKSDIFPHYHQEGFEAAFTKFFSIEEKLPVGASGRVLYRLKKLANP